MFVRSKNRQWIQALVNDRIVMDWLNKWQVTSYTRFNSVNTWSIGPNCLAIDFTNAVGKLAFMTHDILWHWNTSHVQTYQHTHTQTLQGPKPLTICRWRQTRVSFQTLPPSLFCQLSSGVSPLKPSPITLPHYLLLISPGALWWMGPKGAGGGSGGNPLSRGSG